MLQPALGQGGNKFIDNCHALCQRENAQPRSKKNNAILLGLEPGRRLKPESSPPWQVVTRIRAHGQTRTRLLSLTFPQGAYT
jgi:hypothetical protein